MNFMFIVAIDKLTYFCSFSSIGRGRENLEQTITRSQYHLFVKIICAIFPLQMIMPVENYGASWNLTSLTFIIALK
jgi:hypothetical protein